MPERPKQVIIDGIYYTPVDVNDTKDLRIELLRRSNSVLRDRVKYLLDAIKNHRDVYVKDRPDWPSLDEADRKLWEALDD